MECAGRRQKATAAGAGSVQAPSSGRSGTGAGGGGEVGKENGRGTAREGTKGESRSQRFRDRGRRGGRQASHCQLCSPPLPLNESPSLLVPKPQSEATGFQPGAQHLVIALLAFSSPFFPSRAKRKKKRCFKWKEYEKKTLESVV